MTDNVVPGSFTDNYTSRNRVTRRSPLPLCYLDKVVGFLLPRSKASFPVPVPRPPFRFLVPRSGSSFLVYRFITNVSLFFFNLSLLGEYKLFKGPSLNWGALQKSMVRNCFFLNKICCPKKEYNLGEMMVI